VESECTKYERQSKMNGVNKIVLVGRVANKGDLRKAGTSDVLSFDMKTSDTWTKDGNEKTETVTHSVVMWNELAKAAAEALTNGELVVVEGSIKSRETKNKDGTVRKVIEVKAFKATRLADAESGLKGVGLNDGTLEGNIGADADLRTVGDTTVCNFRMGVSESFKNSAGVKQDSTEWISVAIWGKRGESLQPYLTKGTRVCVSGLVFYREYDAKDGSKQGVCEVKCSNIVLLGSPGGAAAAGASANGSDRSAARGKGTAPAAESMAPAAESMAEDEIPF